MMTRELITGVLITVSPGRKLQLSFRCVYYLKKRYPENAEKQFANINVLKNLSNSKQIICMQIFAL